MNNLFSYIYFSKQYHFYETGTLFKDIFFKILNFEIDKNVFISKRMRLRAQLSTTFVLKKRKLAVLTSWTWIWLEIWHLRSRINLGCKHKFTNVVLSLCWEMSKLTVWHFWSAYFDQHLPLQPSIEKRRKQSCTLNTFHTCVYKFSYWLVEFSPQCKII